jgi:hypothetical protein
VHDAGKPTRRSPNTRRISLWTGRAIRAANLAAGGIWRLPFFFDRCGGPCDALRAADAGTGSPLAARDDGNSERGGETARWVRGLPGGGVVIGRTSCRSILAGSLRAKSGTHVGTNEGRRRGQSLRLSISGNSLPQVTASRGSAPLSLPGRPLRTPPGGAFVVAKASHSPDGQRNERFTASGSA